MSGWSRKLIALLALAAVAGCAKREPAASASAQVLRVSQRNEPADLDPATATLPDEFFIIRALSEGLLIPDPAGGAPLPAAAERFDVSPDGLTYTFHLRDARWSNGEPVIAADFVASYRRLLTPAAAATKAHLFFAVKNARAFVIGALADFSAVGFRAPDARTLVVTLAQPAPRFAYYVASGPWIPVNPRVVAHYGRTWTQPDHFVGNGPFTLAEWRQGQRIVVKKNPAYRAANAVRLNEIQFLRFDDGDSEERAFRSGQLDVTMDVPKTKIDTYAREHPAELHRAPLAETRFLSFNTRRGPLSDERVRRALSLAIDREKIVERVLLGGQQPATGFVPVPFDVVSPRERSSWEPRFKPEEAQSLLAEAGFAGGNKFPKFELTAWSQSQVATLEAIQAMWRQHLGIDVTLAVREAKVHLAALAAGTYDIAFVTTLIDVPDASAVLGDFATGAAGNYPGWSNKLYDALLDQIAASSAPGTRAWLQAQADEFLLRAAPVAPLYVNTHNWLMSPRVQGWQEDALWSRSYPHVYLDEK